MVTPTSVRAKAQDALDEAVALEEAVSPPPVEVRYRYQHERLFQRSPSVPPWTPPAESTRGPTSDYVGSGWPWDRRLGDWIDANGVRYGTVPIITGPLNKVSGSTASSSYTLDATAAVRASYTGKRWLALLLRTSISNVYRVIAGTNQVTHAKPKIDVTYVDGTSATLPCWVIAANDGSDTPRTLSATFTLPVLIEFDRPTKEVQSAALSFVITAHWSGTCNLEGFLLDPSVNKEPVTQGIAQAFVLDHGLNAHASVWGLHRYEDGRPYGDFVAGKAASPYLDNTDAEANFDPYIWDSTKPHDTTKWPHRDLGKWVGATPHWTKVESSHSGDGFVPIAPGLGAMRIEMPAGQLELDGSYTPVTPSGGPYIRRGGLAAHAYLFLPEPDFGLARHLFVRYYVRLASYLLDGKHFQISQGNQGVHWIDHGGKNLLMPGHPTSYGAVSGSGGGGRGWTLRTHWQDPNQPGNGPEEGAIPLALHTFDLAHNNPVNHAADKMRDVSLNQIGGMGTLYFDKWYCIEAEMNLNTVMPQFPGWLRDGIIRTWIDGRLVFERSDFVCRSLPLLTVTQFDPLLVRRPCRELGHIGIWFNWFHGGNTPSNTTRVMFITGLAWSRERVGPMRLM